MTLFPGQIVRLLVDAPANYIIKIFSKDELLLEEDVKFLTDKCGVQVAEFEDSCPSITPGVWTVFFRHSFQVRQESLIAIQLMVQDSQVEHSFLRIVDNDTMKSSLVSVINMAPDLYYVNAKGYTIIGEAKCPIPRPPTKFRVRILSKPPISVALEKPVDLSNKGWVMDYEDCFSPNKHFLLFRYAL
jgi:hypothetical protein